MFYPLCLRLADRGQKKHTSITSSHIDDLSSKRNTQSLRSSQIQHTSDDYLDDSTFFSPREGPIGMMESSSRLMTFGIQETTQVVLPD